MQKRIVVDLLDILSNNSCENILPAAARYYECNPEFPNDLEFYISHVSTDASVLELGCGTGRTTLPLSKYCKSIRGIDISSAMIDICKEKISKENISDMKVKVEVGDITKFNFEDKFDIIIAPYRTIQNLVTDDEVKQLFERIKLHLAPRGKCILTAFNPKEKQLLCQSWSKNEEQVSISLFHHHHHHHHFFFLLLFVD
jgi:ubiquinone/menaquinone biosynthesis C-methylase UbiE